MPYSNDLSNYPVNLLDLIREDRKNGLTYAEIMQKHNLKSNNLIKIALGKTTGADHKYRGRHKARYHELLEIEQKYIKIVAFLKKFGEELEDLKCFY